MCLANYSYLADGTKLSSLDDDGDGLLYRGSLIYRKTDGEVALESILFEGGRFVPNGGPMLHVTDHLGSVRAVVNALSGEVTETSDYFPFGMRMDIWGAVEDESNRYRFNGKEDQEGEFGVPTLDYGARHYSATSARWLSMDPLAEKYYSVSPYAFCNNNPVNFVDPDGRDWYEAEDGSIMWRDGNEQSYVDETGKEWENIGQKYTYYLQDGSAIHFYQQNVNGEQQLLSHLFSDEFEEVMEDYIYNDMFLGALGLGPSELAKREISALCESIEKAYKLYSKS